MIVVLFNKDKELTDFSNVHKIVIYKKEDTFKVVKEISDINLNTRNISGLRNSLRRLLEKFGESKIILGNQIIGVSFHFFVQNGFEICEADIFSEEILTEIYNDYVDVDLNNLIIEEFKDIEPLALDETGNYFFDLIKLQKFRPDISSKKALLPFFNNTLFQTITIFASHIMPWIEIFIKEKNLEMTTVREDGIYIMVIYHKVCS